MARRIGLHKRVDLSGLADDGSWEGCYVMVRPATYELLGELSALDADDFTEEKAVELIKKIVKENVVRGQVMIEDDSGNLIADAWQPDDELPHRMTNHIFEAIRDTGGVYDDPKALATPANDGESQNTSKDSETTSSTDSPETSTQES